MIYTVIGAAELGSRVQRLPGCAHHLPCLHA